MEVRLGFLIMCLQYLIMRGEQYRHEDLEKIYSEMSNHRDNPEPMLFKQQINSISRILIWDDQQEGELFDFVFEVKMLEALVDMFSRAKDKQVVNSILGFFTILMTNLSKAPSVNALLSHPAVACLTLAKFNNMNHQIADYYINFVKVLSRKVNSHNLNLFFNKRYASFPLLAQSIRFYNHPDNLVRTTCRNIILTFAKLQNKAVHSYMVGFPFCTYFLHQSNFIKQYWLIADRIVRSSDDNSYQLAHLDSLLQDHEEILIFIDDLLSIKIPGMAQTFTSAFINECMNPLMLSLDLQAKDGFSIQLSLYVLMILFKTINDPFVIDALSLIVFGKYHTKELTCSIYQPVPCLLSYDKKWKFKGFWDSHEQKVLKYCYQTYHEGTKTQPEQAGTIANLMSKIDTAAVFGVTNNFYERQIQKIEQIFGIPIISPKQNLKHKGGASHINELLLSINKNQLNIQDCEINDVSETILSYLNSKDDTLVMLTISLISAYFQNRNISSTVMQFCRMNLKTHNRDFESVIKIQKIVISCIKTLAVDPPCYRICTYLEARDLTKKLSTFYSPKDFPLSADIVSALKNAVKISIDRITPYLYSSKEWERSLTLYLDLLKKGNKRRNKNLKVLGILPNDQEQRDSLSYSIIDYVYQNGPKQFEHQIARDFWIFIIAKDLLAEFNTLHNFMQLDFKPSYTDSYKYQKGKRYETLEDEVIPAEYRRNSQQKYINCSLILLTGYFVLIDRSIVQYRSSYDQFVTIFDRSDPRRLFLKGEEVTIWLQLRQASTAQALLRHLEEGRSTLMRYKLAELVKEAECLLKSCTK